MTARSLLAFVLHRRVSVFVGTGCFLLLGAWSLARMPAAMLPAVTKPRATVVVDAPSYGRDRLLREVVSPMERLILGLQEVESVRSSTVDGGATLRVESSWAAEADLLALDLARKTSETGNRDDVDVGVELLPPDLDPLLEIVVQSKGPPMAADHDRALTFAEERLEPSLSVLPGVGITTVLGGSRRKLVVRPVAAELAAHGLTAFDLARRLSEIGVEQPLGVVAKDGTTLPVVSLETAVSAGEVRQISLGAHGLRVGEVAVVSTERVHQPSVVLLKGTEVVMLRVFRAREGNGLAVARQVAELLKTMQPEAEQVGLQLTIVRDRSEEVEDSFLGLVIAGALGLTLGTLVLWLFLRTWRPAVALAAVVPMSVLSSFSVFYACGLTLDLLALAGLAIAIGMLVDNAIVVLESIHGNHGPDPVLDGTALVFAPLCAGFLTTLTAFAPFFYLKGIARAFLGTQATAIVTVLGASLVMSLTVVPLVVGSRRVSSRVQRPTGGRLYRDLIGRLSSKTPAILAIVGALVLTVAGAIAGFLLRRELVPPATGDLISVSFALEKSLEVAEMVREVGKLDLILSREARGVLEDQEGDPSRLVVYEAGVLGGAVGPGAAGAGRGSARLELSPDATPKQRGERLDGIRVALRNSVSAKGSAFLEGDAMATFVERAAGDLELAGVGRTETEAQRLVERIASEMSLAGGMRASPAKRRRQRSLVLTGRPGAGAEGARGWQDDVRAALGGGGSQFPGVSEGDGEVILGPTIGPGLMQVPVRKSELGAGGDEVVPLGSHAVLSEASGAGEVTRLNGESAIFLDFERGMRGDFRELEAIAGGLARELPGRVVLGGVGLEARAAISNVVFAILVACVLMYFLLAVVYESLLLPIVVMTTVPVAVSGGLLSLSLFNQSLNIVSGLGLLLLVGVVVNNSIVIVHRIEQVRGDGVALVEAIVDAAGERLRPILMTSVTTVLGLVPLALVGGPGAEMRRSLGIALIGGTGTGLIASLVVVPVVRRWIGGRRKARSNHGSPADALEAQ